LYLEEVVDDGLSDSGSHDMGLDPVTFCRSVTDAQRSNEAWRGSKSCSSLAGTAPSGEELIYRERNDFTQSIWLVRTSA